MQESDRNDVAELLQNKTALSRMTHGEIVSALAFLEGAGYDVAKRPAWEEETFKVEEDLREDAPAKPKKGSRNAALEGGE